MSEPESPEPPAEQPVKPLDDTPPKSEFFALGCGCLLIILIFAGAIIAGFQRT